ncbi:P1 family peptidase [Leifsonia lichenia]
MERRRAAQFGLDFGDLPRGRWNAITDVPGVTVGHATIVVGDGALRTGRGPIRTGVTVIRPHDGDPVDEPVFAGFHRLNGNGELTGVQWIEESGLLTSEIALTNTHSAGVVRDALISAAVRRRRTRGDQWYLPVVGETWDGILNDIDGQHVTASDVQAALAAASSGPVQEGGVGGGTGMICHGFKGGIGTSSRVVDVGNTSYTVGVLLQANHGRRERLVIAGHPIGRLIPDADLPVPRPDLPGGAGSVIGIVATDAPLLPHQCRRLAQRVGLGIARAGATGENSSGDLFLAFSTAGRGAIPPDHNLTEAGLFSVDALNGPAVGALFDAVVDAAEESVANALLAADTVQGRDGIVAYALPHHRLAELIG